MKLLINLFLFTGINAFAQADQFIIKEYPKSSGQPRLNRHRMRVDEKNIFEDSTYVVSKTCYGEWGGVIMFRNKKTGVTHTAEATCPVAVNKMNGKYYVTNTLAHMSGSIEVMEIADPGQMVILNMGEHAGTGNYFSSEAAGRVGTKTLAEAYNMLALASFQYKGELYHIVTDYKKTYVATIEDRKFMNIATVCDKSIWTYNPEVFVTPEQHAIVFFKNDDVKGYLDIFENQVNVFMQ